MRVANIDMTNTSQNCPSGLSLITSPKRVCNIPNYGCVSNIFSVYEAQYNHICGRIVAYQKNAPAAFYFHSRGIDADYVYGMSLTHGQSPRKHIWTFVGARDESNVNGYSLWQYPCVNPNLNPTPSIPHYIGTDYFCDTAYNAYSSSFLEVTDPLWDGEGCGPTSTCCYDLEREVNPPWFVKTLSSPTSDDIEMRMCQADYAGSTPIEIVEVYAQ